MKNIIIDQIDKVALKINDHYSNFYANKLTTPEKDSFTEILVAIQMIKDKNGNYIILQDENKNNWKKQMTELEIGQAFETDASNYGSIRAMRSKLRLNGFDFQFKLGKGTLTVRRIA